MLSVEFRAVCGCGVRFNSGRSFRRGGGGRERAGAEVVRALGGGWGEEDAPNDVDDVGKVGDPVP